jgi:chemotaxis protein methyltransferase CheR
MDDLAFEKQFDYIFCRNVFIYFNDQSRFKTLEMLSKNLKLGGYIFVGHTESLFNLPPNLKKVENSIFKKIS